MWSRRELAIYRCGVANRHLMTDGTTTKQLHVLDENSDDMIPRRPPISVNFPTHCFSLSKLLVTAHTEHPSKVIEMVRSKLR